MNFNNTNSNIIITGTAQKDNIENYSSNVSINGGTGDDSIQNYGDNVLLNTGDGNDNIAISSYAKKLTITELTEENATTLAQSISTVGVLTKTHLLININAKF